ncbi:MAG: hypothetical protein RDU01_09560 [Thermodesulfovibrionales bacterium]|nr:hypothetical protein [Thermodesulfovibrionales bacterium]
MKSCKVLIAVFLFTLCFLPAGSWADAKQPVVIFDQGHSQKFVIEQKGDLHLSGLSGLFKSDGFEVKINIGQITDKVLAKTDVLVISGGFKPLASAETEAIVRFLKRGGNLCVMLHIPQPVHELMTRLRTYASNGVLQEQENLIKQGPKEFFVTQLGQHAITHGIKKFAVYGGWALMSESQTGKVIAWTSPKAWIDLNRNNKLDTPPDARQAFGVAVAGTLGKGRYVIFGDDAIFQNSFLVQENMSLGRNLVRWLKNREKTTPRSGMTL